ncbi:hypothetical protein [Candidatus Epulonipiscium viviparus]|uniref:hypothetical protein n=1 Tax=Candidatus Epulonipiscium viviparus TaxID=420336 RepID=UPI0027380986|nr:hypothetical protein [Candidatus Epulopiscium viviparus]
MTLIFWGYLFILFNDVILNDIILGISSLNFIAYIMIAIGLTRWIEKSKSYKLIAAKQWSIGLAIVSLLYEVIIFSSIFSLDYISLSSPFATLISAAFSLASIYLLCLITLGIKDFATSLEIKLNTNPILILARISALLVFITPILIIIDSESLSIYSSIQIPLSLLQIVGIIMFLNMMQRATAAYVQSEDIT